MTDYTDSNIDLEPLQRHQIDLGRIEEIKLRVGEDNSDNLTHPISLYQQIAQES